jgi:SPP1 gp7 family putative phage head morphogenesis protein
MTSEGTSKILNYAYTEARTALADARQQSRFKSTTDIGAEYFQIDATLDSRTTDTCRGLNGIIIKASELDEFPAGLPPYHYNCRTQINAIFSEDLREAVNELGDEADIKFNNEQYIQEASAEVQEGFEG